MSAWVEGHGVGRWHANEQRKQRSKCRRDDRVHGKAPVVVVLGHVQVVIQRRREEEQEFRFHCIRIGFETGQHHPEDREKEKTREGPATKYSKAIFELFYRSENELTRDTVGTGIGLSLVHQMVTSMAGKVTVKNGESGDTEFPGAAFSVSFPLLTHDTA